MAVGTEINVMGLLKKQTNKKQLPRWTKGHSCSQLTFCAGLQNIASTQIFSLSYCLSIMNEDVDIMVPHIHLWMSKCCGYPVALDIYVLKQHYSSNSCDVHNQKC